jgi:hypothetical protein
MSMTMGGLDPAASTAENYRSWASEARGRSPAYESLAYAVAGDSAILGFLGTLPTAKRQPNLLFAAARYLLGVAPGIGELRDVVSGRRAELSQLMLARLRRPASLLAARRSCPRWHGSPSRWRSSRWAPARD